MKRVAVVGEDWDVIDLIEGISELTLEGVFAPSLVRPCVPYLGKDEDFKPEGHFQVVLAVDLPAIRAKLADHYGLENLFTLQSPHAYVSSRAEIGNGSVIQRGVTIMPHVKLGLACKVNINATLHHDVKVGDFCTIAPGALILGNVIIEEGVYVGAGAIIKQRCRIGAGTVIGAGAVVIKDVPPYKTVVGVPAKEMVRESSS